MRFIPILACVLSTLLSKGYSLSCISCMSSTTDACSGPNITCPMDADYCSSIYTKTKIAKYGLTTIGVARGCGYSKECAEPTKTLSNQFMSVDISTSCCKGDNCTPSKPKAPSTNTTLNGLQCPSCFAPMSNKCASTKVTQCTGGENKCVYYAMDTVSRGQPTPLFAMWGCASENLCSNYNGTTTSSEVGKTKVIIACMNATVAPSTNTTVAPSIKTTVIPSNKTTVAPSTNITVAPSTNTTVIPSTKITVAPSTNTSVIPSTKTTVAPSTNTSVVPSTKTTVAPSTSITTAHQSHESKMLTTVEERESNTTSVKTSASKTKTTTTANKKTDHTSNASNTLSSMNFIFLLTVVLADVFY